MKKNLRILSLLLALLMLAMTFAGCNEGSDSTGGTTASTTTANGGTTGGGGSSSGTKPEDGNKTQYTVSLKSIGGRPISGVTFHIYKGDDLTAYGQTDKNGIGTVSLVPANDYTIELSASSLEGYKVEQRYNFTGNSANIVLTSSVIEDPDLTGVRYELGDIMRDFTVTTSDGETFKLSEALKTKKAVLINFWYSTCGPCVNEFPYMQTAYEKYSDDIEVIALNNYPGDNEAGVKSFKETMGLTFPMAKDYSTLGSAFDLQGYPTSIVIDRYGTICLIEVGGLTSEKPFVAVFDHFSADNYQQQLIESIDALTPAEKPNVAAPSSDEIKAAVGLDAIYAPETGTADAEYSWPFIVGETEDNKPCIYPSNSFKDNSFSILHATVELRKDEALAIDWFADTELSVDILYILVDGKDIYSISGTSEEWKTCYPFVAVQDGTYKISFVYVKDGSTDTETDRVLLRNFRIVQKSDIDTATYIPRQAATNPNANGLGFKNYATVVYNEADDYYHVGTKDGPILLVNLMGATQLSETSLNDLGYGGRLMDSKGDVYEALIEYCNYSINGTLYGYSPVTSELKELLERAATLVGVEAGNPNQWLQACSYYDAYGTDKQLEDPVKGVAFFAAFETVESTDTEEQFNTVIYDGRVIMPRGLKYKFVPTRSGAYIIKSQSTDKVDGWIFDENQELLLEAAIVDRPYDGKAIDTTNVSMIIYLEKGKTYYIDIAYYDVYAAGTFTFTVKYLGETYDHFHLASPGYFTYVESTTGQMNQTIAGGIDVALGEDGYYHELRKDGTLGSVVYADFFYATDLFSHSIKKMIELGGFNFSLSSTDQEVLAILAQFGGDKQAVREYYRTQWGDEYDYWANEYKLEEVFAEIYHAKGEDLTDEITAYLNKALPKTDDAPELEGCVPVDEELAKLLQAIVDKYSFSGVKNAWTKLCYYYKSIAP